jgi:dTDP-4-dehydrorhamnose 3,5-epimerase
MKFLPTPLPGSYLVDLTPFGDERGWFARTYCKNEFLEIGFVKEWVQINHSFSKDAGTLRGMHYQLPPHAEIKLVRCVRGRIYDVIVDLRQGSPTFLKWFGAELSAENRQMMFVPEGFGHGFQTLMDDCELIYHHSAFYVKESERGISYNETRIGITWPAPVTQLSVRDTQHPALTADFKGIKL